jgi:hypothetical protein
LPAPRFRAMAALGNWDGATVDKAKNDRDLRHRVLRRLEAESWYEGLRAAAARNNVWFRRHRALFRGAAGRALRQRYAEEAQAARLLLAELPRWRFFDWNMHAALKTLLAQHESYAEWLDGQLDPERLAWLRRMARRPEWWSRLITVAAAVTVVMAIIFLIEAIIYSIS